MVSATPKPDMLKYFHIQLIKILLLKTEDQEKVLRAPREKWCFTYGGVIPQLAADFLSETTGWSDTTCL